MRPIATEYRCGWSVLVCLCVLGTQVSPAETDEPIKMLFGSILIDAQGTTF